MGVIKLVCFGWRWTNWAEGQVMMRRNSGLVCVDVPGGQLWGGEWENSYGYEQRG